MTLFYENETDDRFDFDEAQVAEDVILQTLRNEDFFEDCEVSITVTDDAWIAEINTEYRGIDRPTDVLSFPSKAFFSPASKEEVTDDDIDPDTGSIVIGDIMVSIDTAKRQAAEYGHSELREYAFLIAHSTLHLLGYDHEDDAERQIMEEKQEQVLSALNIRR